MMCLFELQLTVMTCRLGRGDYLFTGAIVLTRRFIWLSDFAFIGMNVSSIVAGGTCRLCCRSDVTS